MHGDRRPLPYSHMDPDRTKRLQAILQWSLRQQEEEGERIQGPRGAQIDPEVMTNDLILTNLILSSDHFT